MCASRRVEERHHLPVFSQLRGGTAHVESIKWLTEIRRYFAPENPTSSCVCVCVLNGTKGKYESYFSFVIHEQIHQLVAEQTW